MCENPMISVFILKGFTRYTEIVGHLKSVHYLTTAEEWTGVNSVSVRRSFVNTSTSEEKKGEPIVFLK